ncbi:1913_t:CDS:2 [Funneliformis caledonium]|uniref:1913_t:CDS:1 n=1 Tax=Funneliformis caledonium TaxID=1117310 RepID=A0A9N9EKM3_9GLOM|nr:1913_t:CDS:2 [Funneliformis caledonium]
MDIDPISKSAIIFGCEWALSENLKVNQKVLTKRITEYVKGLLTIMFHTGTANPRLKMNTNEIHEELLKRVTDNEISKDNVLKVSIIANWIISISRSFKKTMILRLLEEAESSEQ